MATSFENKVNELEARFKALNGTDVDRIPGNIGTNSPTPRRPKPFAEMCFPPSNISVGSPSPSLSVANGSRAPSAVTPGSAGWCQSPARSVHRDLGLFGAFPPKRSPASLTTPSPSPRDMFSPSLRATPDCWNSSPSPGSNDPWRPSSCDPRQATGSAVSSPGSVDGLPRPGSSGSFGSGLALNGTPRQRQMFNLPCSPQTPKSIDSIEIEQKYMEIMKQNGILTINDQRISTDVSELEHVGELGHGSCGHVVKMRHRKTGLLMAVKQMHRSGSNEDNKRIIMDLDVVVKSHSCPYIIECIGTFIFAEEVWICMELMGSCLEKLLRRLQEPIPEPILGKVAVATVSALHYLKEKHGVMHRDVKPSNILVDEHGLFKLCDFGISGRLVDSKAKTRSAGCAAYMAPERIDPPDPRKPDYDIRADVWSLGLSLVELATGEFPYKNCRTDFEMLTKILEEDPPLLPPGKGFSMDFCSFVCHCLAKDYQKRPKYQQLLQHNFITRYSTRLVDVAGWYSDVSRKIELKRAALRSSSTSSAYSHDLS